MKDENRDLPNAMGQKISGEINLQRGDTSAATESHANTQ